VQRSSAPRQRARAALVAALALVAAGALMSPTFRTAAPGAVARPATSGAHLAAHLSSPPTPDQCLAEAGGRCLTPAGLRAAYDLDGLYAGGTTGAGVTIGIVDSFGSPTIQSDIDVYDQQYGLPPITVHVITPAGTPPAFDRSSTDMQGWAGETTLDVEVAHTIAPGAAITLIETPTSETEGLAGFPQIIQAENYVISHHLVDVLSQSFAATEPTFTSPAQVRQLSAEVYPAAKAAGVTVLSSSGDSGPTDVMLDQKTLYTTPEVDWPASDPLVTSVGGTMLNIGADGSRQGQDAAWGGVPGADAGGGGRSTIFPRPTFQASVAGVVGDHRGVPDIALDAANSSGLITYSSFAGPDWDIGGGTSQAAPLMAGIVALADDQAHGRVGYLNDVLYGTLDKEPNGGIVDITQGSNDLVDADGSQDPVPGYQAVAGYDLATGLGTIDGGEFVPALVKATAGKTLPLSSAQAHPTTSASAPGAASSPTPSASSSGSAPVSSAPARPRAAGHSGVHGSGEVTAAVIAGVLVVLVAGGVAAAAFRRRRTGT
jgi:subtilase family serine protease